MNEHKKVYKTKYWQKIREEVFTRDRLVCYFCGRLCTEKGATVHHKEELNENNWQDYDVAYGLDNLVTCHRDCHNIHHQRFGYKKTIVKENLEIDYSKRGEGL